MNDNIMSKEKIKKGIKYPNRIWPYIRRNYYMWKWENMATDAKKGWTDVGEWKMMLHPHDNDISAKLYFEGVYDARSTRYLKANISPGDTVVDIGAQIGYFTLNMASLVGEEGTVLSFEPHPGNFEILSENIARNGYDNRVSAKRVALFDEEATLDLNTHPKNQGKHSIVNQSGQETVSIPAERGDEILPNGIDFIKIDVEGAEPNVLMGLANILETDMPKLIFEYDKNLWNTDHKDVIYMLNEYGYRFMTLPRNETEEPTEIDVSTILEDMGRENIVAEN